MLTQLAVLGAVSLTVVLTALPAFAESTLERRLTLAPGGRFVLDADAGSVTVTGTSASGASVTITSWRGDLDKRYDFQFEEQPGVAKVTSRRRYWGLLGLLGWFPGDGLHFVVQLPRATALDVKTSGGTIDASGLAGSARVRSSGGSLLVHDVEGEVEGQTSGGSISMHHVRGRVSAGTSGGSIDITDVQGAIQANTSGGSIRIDGVTGTVNAETSGGGVRVRGAGDRVQAHTSGGSVTVGFAHGNSRGGDLSTQGGHVEAEIDPLVALSIDASTSGGGVTSDVAITTRGNISRSSLHGDLNGGGQPLRLRTSGGGIHLAAAPK